MKSVYSEVLASTTANVASVVDFTGPCTVFCTVGTIYVSTLTTAPTSADSFAIYDTAGKNSLDIYSTGFVSTVAATTTAKKQIIIWKD